MFLHFYVQLFQHHLWKRWSFLYWNAFAAESKSVGHMWVCFWTLYSILLIMCLSLFLVPYWLNYCTLVLKSDSVVPPNWFFFKIVLVILVSLPLHMHIRISLYIPKISAGIWLELCSIISNCAITSSSLWRINVFTMLSLPVCEHMSLHLFTSSLFLMSAFYSFQCTDPYMLH